MLCKSDINRKMHTHGFDYFLCALLESLCEQGVLSDPLLSLPSIGLGLQLKTCVFPSLTMILFVCFEPSPAYCPVSVE